MNSICEECYGTGRNGAEGDCYPCAHCNQTGSVVPRYIGPNYCGDLNAMHAAEMAIKDDDHHAYACYCSDFVEEFGSDAISLSAAQRAEAFLKIIGKWKEAE